ncbi:IS5 family transposase [Bryobacter aggregatus]|uniref:IS5 family transposase n=1 Tax=Bryobacter aggregatus TaxID=360054 RepID=UPI00192E4B4D|nr:IS5 family transposase [Bryobacter aggregatus]
MRGRWDLKDDQWEVVEPVLRPQRRADQRGRPWHDTRCVLNGVLWVLGSGPQWRELPERYPPYQTCHRRFQQWVRSGKLEETLRVLARYLHERGQLNPEEAFVDATFASAKKGAFAVGPTRRGKGTKIIALAAGDSLPLAVAVDSASPAECQLVEDVLAGSFLDEMPRRLIGDKTYDSDKLDEKLAEEYGIEMIAPNRRNRGKTQDGRPLRRYRRRWRVERLFAWLHHFRRLVTRWEYHVENFLGFVRLGCLQILLRRL